VYGGAQSDACLASIPESSRVQTIFTGGPYDSCLRVPLKDRSNDSVIGGAVFTDTELLASPPKECHLLLGTLFRRPATERRPCPFRRAPF
jgi:hypothetical protein